MKYFPYAFTLCLFSILVWSGPTSGSEILQKRSWSIDMGKFLWRSSTLLYDYKKCERCHPQEYQRYLKGAHAMALVQRKKDAPTCGDCHVTHYVVSNQSRLDLGRWMTELCGLCPPVAT